MKNKNNYNYEITSYFINHLFFIVLLFCYFAFFCYSFITHYANMINKNSLKAYKKNNRVSMSVKLRQKNLAGGKKSLYLDIYHNKQRHYEFLKLYLFKGTHGKTKADNSEILMIYKITCYFIVIVVFVFHLRIQAGF